MQKFQRYANLSFGKMVILGFALSLFLFACGKNQALKEYPSTPFKVAVKAQSTDQKLLKRI